MFTGTDLDVRGLGDLNGPSRFQFDATGDLFVGNVASSGQTITLTAGNNITAGNLSTPGQAISLVSNTGAISTGDLMSTASNGGNITVAAAIAITLGLIDSSGTVDDGGDVSLDPLGDVEFMSINAQGGQNGQGGSVDITTVGGFVRGLSTFTDQNGVIASISTAGGNGGGAITIRHQGSAQDPLQPFDVAQGISVNGTLGDITSGELTIPSGSYSNTFSTGTENVATNINLIALASIPGPKVASIAVDDASGQRSMVRTVTITFDRIVSLDPGAIEIEIDGGVPLSFTQATELLGGKTIATLTFDGVGGSLADGRYNLTVFSEKVHAAGETMAADVVDNFFRLFGDLDGNELVNRSDLVSLLRSYGAVTDDAIFNDRLDHDAGGSVALADLGAFQLRLAKAAAPLSIITAIASVRLSAANIVAADPILHSHTRKLSPAADAIRDVRRTEPPSRSKDAATGSEGLSINSRLRHNIGLRPHRPRRSVQPEQALFDDGTFDDGAFDDAARHEES